MAVSEANTLAIAASLRARPSRSMRAAAAWVSSRAARTRMAMPASLSLMA